MTVPIHKFEGDTGVSGGLQVSGDFTANSLTSTTTLYVSTDATVVGNLSVQGTLNVAKAVVFSSTFAVAGASTFTGATAHNGGLTATTGQFSDVLTQMTGAGSYGLLANGTTAQRPSNVEARFRYNTDLHIIEWYNGTAWTQPTTTAGIVGKCALAVAAVPGTISAVNVGTEVITQSVNHNLTTGELVWTVSGTSPTGMTANAVYYVNALSANTYAIYTTLTDATNDTNRVNLTVGTTGAGLDKATVTVSATSGLATNPFQFTCATVNIAGTVTVATAFTTTAWMPVLNWATTEAFGAGAVTTAGFQFSSLTTTVLTYALSRGTANTAQIWTNLNTGATYYIAFQGYNG